MKTRTCTSFFEAEDVRSVVFLNDKLIAAAGCRMVDGTKITGIFLLEAATGQVRRTLYFGFGPLAVSPDRKLLACIGGPGDIQLREAATLELKETLHLPGENGVRAMAFAPDGKTLAATHAKLHIFDLIAKKHLAALEAFPDVSRSGMVLHARSVDGIAFLGNGKYLATSSPYLNVKIWDAIRRKEDMSLWELDSGVGTRASRCLTFSPDSKRLAVSDSEDLQVWDWGDKIILRRCKGHTKDIISVAFSPKGDLLATGGKDGAVILWDGHEKPVLLPGSSQR